jgi:hypothetical protein
VTPWQVLVTLASGEESPTAELLELVRALARRRVSTPSGHGVDIAAEDVDDLVQDVVLSLWSNAGAILQRLVARNPWLESLRSAGPSPSTSEADASASAIVARYVQAMIATRYLDLHATRRERDWRSFDALPSPPAAEPQESPMLAAFHELKAAFLEGQGALRDQKAATLQEVVELARGTCEMASLSRQEVDRDPKLRAQASRGAEDVTTAMKTARNRLQQRHKRLRDDLLQAIPDLVRRERLSAEDGELARGFVERLLRRRQKVGRAAVGGGE